MYLYSLTSVIQVMDAIVIICALILNPMARRRRKRLAAEPASDNVAALGDDSDRSNPETAGPRDEEQREIKDEEKSAEVRCGEAAESSVPRAVA
ncbi:hypothetical protein C2E23DRAFT_824772 [Lenzites betulinus]|nr:hypothetical protein C2E23DRAFT_824772 [Lenzites betulinus]